MCLHLASFNMYFYENNLWKMVMFGMFFQIYVCVHNSGVNDLRKMVNFGEKKLRDMYVYIMVE